MIIEDLIEEDDRVGDVTVDNGQATVTTTAEQNTETPSEPQPRNEPAIRMEKTDLMLVLMVVQSILLLMLVMEE